MTILAGAKRLWHIYICLGMTHPHPQPRIGECAISELLLGHPILILIRSSKAHAIDFNPSASSAQRESFLGCRYLIYGIDSRICSLPCAHAHPWPSRGLRLRGGCLQPDDILASINVVTVSRRNGTSRMRPRRRVRRNREPAR